MFENINLQTELSKIRENRTKREIDDTLEAFKDLFRADCEREKMSRQNLSITYTLSYIPRKAVLDTDKIFDISAIKSLCTKYRLRFLLTTFLKTEFPPEAIRAIITLEKNDDTEIKSFMIIA